MKLEWILLAFFLVSIIRNVAKALRNPMLKNFLRLISILVAFIITFVLQICGFFQHTLENWVEGLELASKLPGFEGPISNAIKLFLPFCTTILSPVIFVLVFAALYLLLQVLHVNLTYKFIVKRRRRKEIRELKKALREEKQMLKQALTENEERFLSVMNEMAATYPGMDVYKYDALDEDEIDKMVEQRIKLEKKKRKKAKYFKESSERKAISVVCGVVSGFLLFGIWWMGTFYTMDFLSDVTDVIYETNAEETKVYQAIEMVDKHLITPYEDSFVYKLYDSMAMVNLMKFTVQSGGQIEGHPSSYPNADQMMRAHTKSAIRLACEITSDKPSSKNISEDVSALTNDPAMVSLIADFLVAWMDTIDTENIDPSNVMMSMLAPVVNNYKGDNGKYYIVEDLGVVSNVVVLGVENRALFAKIMADNSNIEALISDRVLLGDLAATVSHLSFYPTTMYNAFKLGVDALGATLVPADNAAAYEKLLNTLVDATSSITSMSAEDVTTLQNWFKGAAACEKNNYFDYINEIEIPDLQGKLTSDEFTDEEKDDFQAQLDKLTAELEAFSNGEKTTVSIYDYFMEPVYALKLAMRAAEKLEEKGNNILDAITDAEDKIKDIESSDGNVTQEELEEWNEFQKTLENLKKEYETLESDLNSLIEDAQDQVTALQDRLGGLGAFVSYFMNWTNVQKPFMIADEDLTTACLAIVVDGKTYVCDTDAITIEKLFDIIAESDIFGGLGDLGGTEEATPEPADESGDGEATIEMPDVNVDEYLDKIPMKELFQTLFVIEFDESNPADMEGRVSALTHLVNHLIFAANEDKNTSTVIDREWLYAELGEYITSADAPEACVNVATRIVNAKDDPATFDYKGVTIVMMEHQMNFGLEEGQEWTLDQKEDDSRKLVNIIFTLFDVVQAMNGTTGEESGDNSQVSTLIGLLAALGESMDQMSNTVCLAGIPRVMVEAILKNDMLSVVMTPAMLYGENGYLSRIDNGESYATVLTEIADIASSALDQLGGDDADGGVDNEGSGDVNTDVNGEVNGGVDENNGEEGVTE